MRTSPPPRSFASPLFRENPREKKTVLGEKKKIEKVYGFSYSSVMQLQVALWVLSFLFSLQQRIALSNPPSPITLSLQSLPL
jgi:hypothetical protein